MNELDFTNQSLRGARVMVTRPADPRDPLAEQLRQLGADVLTQPAICIGPPADWRPVDAALARLDQFDWLVFSSANGVRRLLERMREKRAEIRGQGPGARGQYPGLRGTLLVDSEPQNPNPDPWPLAPELPKLAAMGPGTADELARCGLRADLVPGKFCAEALVEALAREARGRRFLLARASRGREVLAEQLVAAGGAVEQIVVYSSTDVQTADPGIADLLRAGRIDWITVTSSAIARSLVRLFGEDLRCAKLASISPITSGVLRELGCEPAVEAAEYTLPGLAAAMARKSAKSW